MATLIFNDTLQHKALMRASDPKAPATLLIELLRANIPEKFSRNDHKCDSSKSDEILRRFREGARRELEAGHPKLRKMAEGAENAYAPDDHYEMNVYQAEPVTLKDNDPSAAADGQPHGPSHATRHTGGGRYPEDVSAPPYGSHQDPYTPTSPGSPSAPSVVSPPSRAERREQLRQQRKEEKKNTFPVKRF